MKLPKLPSVQLRPNARDDAAIPTLAEALPQYAELQARRERILREIDTTESAINDLLDATNPAALVDRRSVRIGAILGDDVPAIADVEPNELPSLQRHLRDLRAAMPEIDRRLREARFRASALICEAVEPRYRVVVSKVCDALQILHVANVEYARFVDELNDKEVAWTRMRPMPPSFCGAPNDPGGRLASYLQEAAVHGFIDAEDVPKELRVK